MTYTITRAAAVQAFETIKKNGGTVCVPDGPSTAAWVVLEDIAAETDEGLASENAQAYLRGLLTVTRDYSANMASRARKSGKEDAITLHNIGRSEAVVAACNAALGA